MDCRMTISHPSFPAVLVGGLLMAACGGSASSRDLPCPIPAELMQAPPTDAVTFTLDNRACTTICSLNLSPHRCDDWGGDWLGDHNVPSGESVSLRVPPGSFDLWIEDCTMEPFIVEGLDLCQDLVFLV
jgi:hypothetical protein